MGIYYYLFNKETKEGICLGKRGKRKDTWAVTVSGNWRITFKFENENAHVVDYEDYH